MANRTIYLKDEKILLEAITKAGYTLRGLARKMGISQTTISLILQKRRNPSPNTAVSICKATGCNFDDIFFIKSDYNL